VTSSNSHSQLLLAEICDRIAASPQQQITFADYMALILYHPQYGYYSSGTVQIGARGDFFTASSLGTDFGELLAEQFFQMWEILGCSDSFALVEMGAGQGLLASDILGYLANNYPHFSEKVEYIIVEQSSRLIERQQQELSSHLERGSKVSWKAWNQIESNSIIGCFFSNELVDAFPVHIVRVDRGNLQEIYVCEHQGKLREVSDSLSTNQLSEYFKLVEIDLPSDSYPNGYQTEVNLAALPWLKTVSEKLKRGYLVTIDYGYIARRYYHPQRHEGTLQCYYQHRHHNDPYLNLGLQDVTAHVNFTALERQGERCGLQHLGLTQQGLFLMALGAGERLSELASGNFTIQQVLQRRDALHQLIDPSGMGGFHVLVQSKGLEEKEAAQTLQGLSFRI